MGARTAQPQAIMETLVLDGEPVSRQKAKPAGLAWRLRVYDPRTGKQPERTFYGTYAAAVRELAKRRAETEARANPLVTGHKSLTLEEWAGSWLEQYAWKVPPAGRYAGIRRPYSTWKKAESITYTYLLPMLGASTKLSRISHKDLLAAIGGLERADGQPLAGSSKETVASVARSLFRDAVLAGVSTSSPASALPTVWDEGTTSRTALIPSIANVEGLAEAMDKTWPLPPWAADLAGPNGEGHGDLVRVLTYTGLRWQELAALEAGAVHPRRRVLDVTDTASESGGLREHRRNQGKSRAAIRHVALVDQALPAISRLDAIRRRGLELEPARQARREARGSKKQVNRPDAERWLLLAAGEQGGFMSYAYWRKQLAKSQEQAGVSYTAHDLRHVCAAVLYSAGESVEVIREQMGHASEATTRRVYRHLFLTDRSEVGERVSKRFVALGVVELEAE